LPKFNAAPGEGVHLLSRDRGLGSFRASLLGNTLPRIRNGAIEKSWMKALDNAPSATTQRHGLLTLAWTWTARPPTDDVVDFVGANGRDRSDLPTADTIPFFGDDIRDQ
jgi:hypothetical protein